MGRAGCLLLQNKERIAQAVHGLEAISLMKFAFNAYARPDGMWGRMKGAPASSAYQVLHGYRAERLT